MRKAISSLTRARVLEVVLCASDVPGAVVPLDDLEAVFRGQDWRTLAVELQSLRDDGVISLLEGAVRLSASFERSLALATVWHEHVFAPSCTDEVNGRFDAVEDESGALYVLDVGSWLLVERCRTRVEALTVAQCSAAQWEVHSLAATLESPIASASSFRDRFGLTGSCDIWVGAGWVPTFEQALRAMIAAGWDRHLDQAKQKLGQLVIYVGRSSASLQRLIDRETAGASLLCERCGLPHHLRGPLSGLVLCGECERRR